MVKGLSFFSLFSNCLIEKELILWILKNIKSWTAVSYAETEKNICRRKLPPTPHKCHCGVGQIGQYFSNGKYSNYLFYEVSKRFNNLLPEQNPTQYSEKQLEIYRLVQSLHKDGLGYRRIAKVLNEKGLTTEEGHLWKNTNVYSVLKRYSERQDRLKFRRKNYPLVRGKMWI